MIMRQLPKIRLTEQENLHMLRLARTPSIGPITFFKLMERYKTAERVLAAIPELSRRGGRKTPITPPPMSVVEDEYNAIVKAGGTLITCMDEQYPLELSAIEDAPPVITVFGHPHLLTRNGLGIVGARNASLNGKRFAEKIATECAQADLIVVSGLARGIDTHAHTGAIAAGTRGGTIAVVAGGPDVIYPRENEALYKQIVEVGAVVSENPMGAQPRSQDFPRRNRIISSLSTGVLVVEASLRSGSLITARLAGEQGRDVFAVPGFPGDPRAQGPNSLLKDGAFLVQDVNDILQNLRPFHNADPDDPQFRDKAIEQDNRFVTGQDIADEFEDDIAEDYRQTVLDNLSYSPILVDDLIEACNVSSREIQIILLELELAGRLQRHRGNKVNLIDAPNE